MLFIYCVIGCGKNSVVSWKQVFFVYNNCLKNMILGVIINTPFRHWFLVIQIQIIIMSVQFLLESDIETYDYKHFKQSKGVVKHCETQD